LPAPGQPAPEILQFLVTPALGFTNRLGDRLREQWALGHQLLEPGKDRPRPVNRLSVNEQPRHGAATLTVEPLHVLGVLPGLERDAFVFEALVPQRRLDCHARM